MRPHTRHVEEDDPKNRSETNYAYTHSRRRRVSLRDVRKTIALADNDACVALMLFLRNFYAIPMRVMRACLVRHVHIVHTSIACTTQNDTHATRYVDEEEKVWLVVYGVWVGLVGSTKQISFMF